MSPSPDPSSSPVYTVQGRNVPFPVCVRDASSGAATYLVSASAVRRLLPGDVLEPVEPLPGRALLSIAAIDYRDNDLGDYNEISIAFFVRERSAPKGIPYLGSIVDFLRQRTATYIHRLPVNQSFTRDAGFQIWGFPKTVDEIEFQDREGLRECRWSKDGSDVFRFVIPRGGSRDLPETEMTTYTFIEGVPHETRFASSAEGVGFRLGGASLTLGDHPIAAELRDLGLPKRALMSVWMERMRGRFEPPRKL